jgi:hypothetical protein
VVGGRGRGSGIIIECVMERREVVFHFGRYS